VENIKTQGLWKIKKHKDCGKYKNTRIVEKFSTILVFLYFPQSLCFEERESFNSYS
jgi:hypothetical protein